MKNLLLMIAVVASAGANAESIYCEGKIDNSYITNGGDVVIRGDWRDHWTKVCNVNDSDVVKCSLWTSYVTSAVQNNLKVTVSYSNTGYTCSNLPTYTSAPVPAYIMIHNMEAN